MDSTARLCRVSDPHPRLAGARGGAHCLPLPHPESRDGEHVDTHRRHCPRRLGHRVALRGSQCERDDHVHGLADHDVRGAGYLFCSGGTVVGTATVSGDGSYHPSASFTPTAEGAYPWYATYSGDAGNTAAASTCSSLFEMPVTGVSPAYPSLALSAPSPVIVGTAISASSITATLSSAFKATGTITFKVAGPQGGPPQDASACASGPTVGTASVSGNGAYNPSATFTPTEVGNYWWYATYGGDSNNQRTPPCGSVLTETVALTRAAAMPHVLTFQVFGTTVAVTINCGGIPCDLQLTLKARGTTVGTAEATMAAGQTKHVRVELNGTGEHRLKKARKLRTTLKVTQSGTVIATKTVAFHSR
jgi:hypothetical protein